MSSVLRQISGAMFSQRNHILENEHFLQPAVLDAYRVHSRLVKSSLDLPQTFGTVLR